MARKGRRAAATAGQGLTALQTQCAGCGQLMWVAYHTRADHYHFARDLPSDAQCSPVSQIRALRTEVQSSLVGIALLVQDRRVGDPCITVSLSREIQRTRA